MENFLLEIRKFILSKILRRKYYRTGKCKACGKCCTKIYVKHFKHVIQDEEEFKKLQYLHRFYTYLKVIDKDETGLVFECQNLDPETHKCKIHKSRPGICRRYPQEELFSMGGALSDDCGYKMLPIVPFSTVLSKMSKSKKISLILFMIIIFAGIKGFAYNGFSDGFIEKFKTCDIYGETASINLKGTVFNDMKFFAKENANTCHYHQVISSHLGSISLICKFNMEQVQNLYDTMINNNPPYEFSEKAGKIWDLYVNDSDVCTIEKKTAWDREFRVPQEYVPWTIPEEEDTPKDEKSADNQPKNSEK